MGQDGARQAAGASQAINLKHPFLLLLAGSALQGPRQIMPMTDEGWSAGSGARSG